MNVASEIFSFINNSFVDEKNDSLHNLELDIYCLVFTVHCSQLYSWGLDSS